MTAENPTVSDLRDERQWEPLGFVSNLTASGARVTPQNSLSVAAYFDGIRIIAEDIGKLPFTTHRRLEPRGKERAPEHPVFPLLRRAPNENMGAMSFSEAMTANAISWGGGFALIDRDGRGTPRRLDLVHPSRVKVDIDDAGRIFYEVGVERNRASIRTVIVRQSNMFHLHGLSDDGVNGYSVARIGAESLGRAMAQDRFSSSFFKSGSSPKGAIRVMKKFRDQEEIDRMRFQWQENYAGEQGWHKPLILEQGAEWQTITIPPEEAQMIESQNFSVLEIARWLRIAPHKLGHLGDATFTNVEEMNIDHVNDTLMPWARRWEEEATRKLFIGEEEEFFAKHNFKALLRGNSQAQGDFLREMFNIGGMSQNDIREAIDMNPIGEEGDVYYISGNMVRSEDAAEGEMSSSDPPSGRIDGFDNEAQQIYFGLFRSALDRCDSKEELAKKNAKKRKDYDDWVGSFLKKHEDYVRNSIHPIATALSRTYCPQDDTELIRIASFASIFAHAYCQADGGSRRVVIEAMMDKILERMKT